MYLYIITLQLLPKFVALGCIGYDLSFLNFGLTQVNVKLPLPLRIKQICYLRTNGCLNYQVFICTIYFQDILGAQPREEMSDSSDSLSEEERSLFRPFTRESLASIEARISEEYAKQKELEKKRAEGEVYLKYIYQIKLYK